MSGRRIHIRGGRVPNVSDRWLYAWGLGSVAFGGASLLVPLYLVQLGGSAVDLGVLAASAALAGVPGALFFGQVGSQLGRQRLLLIGTLATVAIGLVAVPMVQQVWAVIALNAAIWFVSAGAAPILTMLAVEGSSATQWSERIGRLNKYQGYGWAAGLVLGTVWGPLAGTILAADVVLPTLFVVLAGCAGLSIVGVRRTLPREATVSVQRGQRLGRLVTQTSRGVRAATFALTPGRLYWMTRTLDLQRLRVRLTPALLTYLGAAMLFFTGFAAFWAPLPLFLTLEGFTTGQVFGLYLVSSLGSAVLYERIGRRAAKTDIRRLQAAALAMRGFLFPATVLVAGLGGVWLAWGSTTVTFAAIGVTWAIIAVVGTVIITRLAPPAIRGEALGLYTAVGSLAGGLGGILGGWLAALNYWVAFAVAGALVIVGSAVVLTVSVISTEASPLST